MCLFPDSGGQGGVFPTAGKYQRVTVKHIYTTPGKRRKGTQHKHTQEKETQGEERSEKREESNIGTAGALAK